MDGFDQKAKFTWQSGGQTRTAWCADYFDQQGKRRLKTFRTRREADSFLVTARGQVASGTHTADSVSVTIAAAADLWLERCEAEGLEAQSIRTYRNLARYHVLPLLGHERLARLTTPRVERFRDELLATRSRVTARRVLTCLKMILRDAQRRALVAQNVARDVRISASKRHKAPVTIPSKDEVKALLEAAIGRWRPLLVAAVFTGLRASELRGLTWSDVDFDARLIRVGQRADRWGAMGAPKSAAARRDIPMTPLVMNTLREWRLVCPKGGLVFPNGRGLVENLSNIQARGVAPAQIAAGIVDADGKAKYSLHALRHFFASWLIDQGFGPKRVQYLMGHSGVQITLDTYTHLWPQEDDHAKFAAAELAITG